jgi:RNA polymerase sigma factor (sigma-70 family)
VTLFRAHPELLPHYRRGERPVLERVYRHYVRDVMTLLRSGFTAGDGSRIPPLHESADVLDALQEAFARAFAEKARLSYDGLRPYRPFLLQIAKNLRIDQLRANRTQRASNDAREDGAEELADPASASLSSASSQERREWQQLETATREFLAGVDEGTRGFVARRFEAGHSQAEVAEMMGISRKLVRTLEDRVQADLRRFLQQRGLI